MPSNPWSIWNIIREFEEFVLEIVNEVVYYALLSNLIPFDVNFQIWILYWIPNLRNCIIHWTDWISYYVSYRIRSNCSYSLQYLDVFTILIIPNYSRLLFPYGFRRSTFVIPMHSFTYKAYINENPFIWKLFHCVFNADNVSHVYF